MGEQRDKQRLRDDLFAIFYMVASTLAITFFGFTNKEGARATSVELAVLMRFAIPTLVLTPFLLFLHDWIKNFADLKDHFRVYFLRALFVMIGQYALTYYIKDTNLLDAMTLYNTGPLFMPFLLWLVFGTPIDKKVIGALICGLIGVLLILKPRSSDFLSWHTAVGLLSGFSTACSQVCQFYSSKNSNHFFNIYVLYFFCTILFALVVITRQLFFPQHMMFYVDWDAVVIAWFLSAAFLSMLNQVLKDHAYGKTEDANILTPLMYFTLLFSGILDWIIYDKLPTLDTIIGSMIIIASAIYILHSKRVAKNG